MNKTLADLLHLLCSTFASDPSSPSLIISWLEDSKTWYISVCRYHASYGRRKQVLARVTGKHLDRVVDVACERITEICTETGVAEASNATPTNW